MKIHFASIVQLLHTACAGHLATHSTHVPGYPFASLLPFVPDERHCPVFLISALGEHTKNLNEDARASFLMYNLNGPNVLMSERLTMIGDVERIEAPQLLAERYVRYQPDAQRYLALGDFSFFRLNPTQARYIAGFGHMGWLEESEWSGAAVLPLEMEQELIRTALDREPAGIRLLGVDCYGFDIEREGMRERQRFPNGPLPADRIAAAIQRFLPNL